MKAKEFLRIAAASMPRPLEGERLARFLTHTAKLISAVPDHRLSPRIASAVGARLDGVPPWEVLLGAIQDELAADTSPPPEPEPQPCHWMAYVEKRLGEGANPDNLLSFVRQHCEPAAYRAILQRFDPAALHRLIAEEAERRAYTAQAHQRHIDELARRYRMPSGFRPSHALPTEPKKPRPEPELDPAKITASQRSALRAGLQSRVDKGGPDAAFAQRRLQALRQLP